MVEFVSANPTGPLHVGHGRQAALGDAISTLLEWQGWRVTREFYYNDAGNQIANLALSVQARIQEGARRCRSRCPRTATSATTSARSRASTSPRTSATRRARTSSRSASSRWSTCARSRTSTCSAFGVKFDSYFLESSLYTDGKVDETVEMLKKAGHTYESEGALWLKTTDFGDDKDRVMRKCDGTYTYFVPDVAYHLDQVPPRLRARGERAGRGPPLDGDARARGPAGARDRHPEGLPRLRAAPDGDGDARAARR